MQVSPDHAGSAARWGPLFGARAHDWAETWEGPSGWGTHVYEHVLDRARVGPGSTVLDCGCGAGRFARMAADRGACVAGIDASSELIAVAAARTPDGEFRVGDIETLPYDTDSFDVVTGFSSFQFADDKQRALREANRVSADVVAVVIPTRVAESAIAAVFKPLLPLFPPEALDSMRRSGMFALSEPGALDLNLDAASLDIIDDDEIQVPVTFDSADLAVRAFIGAGPIALAVARSGRRTVGEALRASLRPFTDPDDMVALPSWFRVVLARAGRTNTSQRRDSDHR